MTNIYSDFHLYPHPLSLATQVYYNIILRKSSNYYPIRQISILLGVRPAPFIFDADRAASQRPARAPTTLPVRPAAALLPTNFSLIAISLRATIVPANTQQGPDSVGSLASVMGRFPSSTIFNRRPSRFAFSFTSFGACGGSDTARRVHDVPELMRLRFRIGRLEWLSVLRRSHDPGCVLRQALASVRGRRVGRQHRAWSRAIPECRSE